MTVKADLHVHSTASIDGSSTVAELAVAAKAQGLDAIAVCDHDRFSALPESAPVLLIPGIEITSAEGHILGLFPDRPVRLPEGGRPTAKAAVDAIHAAGGIAVLAHPFGPQKLPEERLKTLPVDAVEAVNARSAVKTGANERALALAEAMRLPVTGASDAHCAEEVGGAYTELDVSELSLSTLRQALLEKKARAVLRSPCLWRYKARSRLKKRRTEHGVIGLLRTIPYAAGCLIRDLLHL